MQPPLSEGKSFDQYKQLIMKKILLQHQKLQYISLKKHLGFSYLYVFLGEKEKTLQANSRYN